MLRFLSRRPWDIRNVLPPWGDRPSIYRHLQDQLAAAPTGSSRRDIALPDEDQVIQQSGGGLRWVAGALDGVAIHHMGSGESEEVAGLVLDALTALTRKDSNDRAAALYSRLSTSTALHYLDALLPLIAQSARLRRDRVQAIARWLATEAADREPVKAAIAILGVVGGGDRELLLTLGGHEEFSLFSAIALQQTEDHPEPLLWQLAQDVTGWGRIHIVERLAGTRDDRIKSWLLREGYSNDIMTEYTALVCATSGELVSALRSGNPDDALMKGAGAILSALVRGGPAEGIEGYSDGAEATELYLAHLRKRDADLDDVNVVATIERFVVEVRQKADDWTTGWRDRVPAIDAHVHAIKARPDWPAKIQSGLSSTDGVVFSSACEAATLFGIDTWELHFERLQGGDDRHWYAVMQTEDPARIERVLRHAEEQLPLEEIATGPADELGLGQQFRPHRALDYVLQDLRRFPGRGWRLIRAGLQSPVTRNRNMALRALATWDRATWPPGTEFLLRRALQAEPNEDTRGLMRNVLNGEPLQL